MLLANDLAAQELIFVNSFENCTPGVTRVWGGNGNNINWSGSANWQGNVIPGNGDSVSIQSPGPQATIFNSTLGSRQIRCLNSKRALTVTGGNLEILQTAVLNSSIAVTGGSLKVTGRLRAIVQ